MSDYQSIHTGAVIDAAVSAVTAGEAGIQGVKVNGTELTPDEDNKVDVTVPSVVQSTGQSTTNVMSQKAVTDAIAGGGGVTVVQTIGSSTTSVMSQNAVTEVSVSGIKVNGLELTKDSENKYSISVPTVAQRPGSSTTEVMSQNAVTSELDGKLGSEDIVQITGTSTDKVMSQKAVTDSLPNIVQTTGTSTTDIMSQKAVTDAIAGGGGVTVVQTIGTSTTSVMSQKAVTDVSISGFYVNGNEILKTNSNTYEIEVPTVTNRAGDSPSIAMSQKAVTDGLAAKVDTSAIVQTTGTSTTDIMSQKAVTDAIAGGGVTVVQTTGTSTTSVMSQNAVTEELDAKATKASYTATLESDDWEGDAAPYTQTVDITGILATDIPIVDLASVTQDSLNDWARVSSITTAAGSITATCLAAKPSSSLSLRLLVLR